MRITIWLSIIVFVTTLFWPKLLTESGLILAAIFTCFIYIKPSLRFLLSLPLTAIYFTLFVYIVLSGGVLKQPQEYQATTNVFNGLDNGQHHTISVKVKSLINDKNSGYFVANVISINEQACYACPLIEMRWYQPSIKVQAGELHQFLVRINKLRGKGNPAGFDREKWRYSQHIAYIARVKQHLQVLDDKTSWRTYFYNRVYKITQGLQQQGAILALTFADKSVLTWQQKQQIKQLGIAHLFAISGLHIGLLFVLAITLFKPIVNRYLPKAYLGWHSWRIIQLCSLLVCCFYGYLSGFSLPTQRALLMLLITIWIFSMKRKTSGADILLLVCWFILLLDPLAILSSSLWLSFTAIAAILLFIWIFYRFQKESQLVTNKIVASYSSITHYIKWLILLQLTLTLLMLPVQLWHFSAISINALVVNLIAIPLFSWLIIPLSLAAVLIVFIYQPVAALLFELANYLLTHFFTFLEPFDNHYIELSDGLINLLLSLFILLILLKVLLFIHHKYLGKKSILWLPLLAFVAALINSAYQTSVRAGWSVSVFDIGQGLAVLISSEGEHLLYDTGPSYPPNFVTAEQELLPYFNAQGIKQLRYLVVSHSDNDHAGGAQLIRQSLLVEQALSGEAKVLSNRRNRYQQCPVGETKKLGALTIEFLSPLKVSQNNNNNSCVLRIGDPFYKVLLSGDIHQNLEKQLLKKYKQTQLQADILVAPHHGSNTSSSNAFIESVAPKWVIFSAGYQNQWGFPKKQVVQRYLDHQVEPLMTGDSGFIRFNMQNQQIKVETYREDLAGYWYHQQPIF